MLVGAIFFPLLGACISGFFGRWIGDRAAMWSSVFCMALAAICGLLAFWQVALGGQATTVTLFTWMDVGELEFAWALRYDTLSAIMVGMVTLISTLIHIYSVGYMSHDATPSRFFAYLSLFTFMMLMLVTADNLVQLFFGWEGVGLASYLLIGYWYEKESANAAAMKAFIVNRVGDLFFMLGMALTFLVFGSLEFNTIFAAASSKVDETFLGLPALELIGVLLFLGACGKSAQLGLHTWLPDAMEGPTPVSALIHAATMVTAGVFLICRMSPVMEYAPVALAIVTVVGASTAIFAATIGCVQNDIKRIIAYSTCSQLGYMFFAAGVGLYQAAMFHLFTHAFFKALLFLGAGSVIHAMSDEQDIRKMGGIWKKIPVTYAVMWVGSLALAGIPIFAGYYSKDAILEGTIAAGSLVGGYAFLCGILAAFLTAFYSWRLLILTFHGAPRADHHTMAHVHESPLVMLIPLLVLAAGAIATGFTFAPYFIGEHAEHFWNGAVFNLPAKHMMEALHHAPEWVPLMAKTVAISGIGFAILLYGFMPQVPARIAAAAPGVYRFLLNKWYFDELYERIFVQPARRLAVQFWQVGDVRIIDGMPNGAASMAASTARGVVRLQTGRVANYAFAMIIGVVVFVSLYLMGRSAMNAAGFPILSLVTFLPLLGALVILCVRGEEKIVASNARWTALWTSLITFALSLVLWAQFDKTTADYQFIEQVTWLPEFGVAYIMGVDGISVLFVLLATALTPLCILASWESVQSRVREYMVAFLILETMMVGMFCALDFILFYIFFEAVLIPMFLIIGIWGGARRVYASYKFFLYTLLGSVLMLLAIIALWYQAGTTNIPELSEFDIPFAMQVWLFLAFFASFAVKVPMWPVHTWLPDAHVEAPTAGSVILAGVLLKMGAYGFLRFSLPLLPEASQYFAPFIYVLSIVAVVYTSLVALAQTDMKKLIAYSSVAHMGIVTLGIFTFNQQGIEGALFTMLSHGVVSGALFLCVGVLYDRVHSREIARYGGVAKIMPAYALVFMLFTMASVALPGTAGFPGEFLVILGAWAVNPWVAFGAALGMVLGAAYMLTLYRRVAFGKITREDLRALLDLSPREYAIFTPLIALTLWMGIYPQSFLSFFSVTVSQMVQEHQASISAASRLAGL